MADVQDLSTMSLAFMKQAGGLGVPQAGAGASGLEVLPSTGLASSIAAIESAMIKRNRMKRRPRHGPKTVTASYETELSVGPGDPIFEAVLGGPVEPLLTLDESDLGALTITATADYTQLAFATAAVLTNNLRAGMFIRLSSHATAGNNGKWCPIIFSNANNIRIPLGYLVAAAAEPAYGLERAPYYATPASYVDTYFSLEEYLSEAGVDMSKYGTDLRFNSLNFSVEAKSYMRYGFGMQGRDMTMMEGVDAPVFDNPTYISGDSLILLDGGLYTNFKRRLDLTTFKFGIAAPTSTTDVIGTNVSPDISLGQFAFTGDFAGVIANSADFTSFDDEEDISLMFHCKRKRNEGFVGIYAGYTSFGGYSTPMGGEGLATQSITLFGGEDEQDDHLPTTLLISTSDT